MEKTFSEPNRRPLTLLLATAAALLFTGGFTLLLAKLLQLRCGFRALFHIPCPSCGCTRATEALLQADLPTAFSFNPLFTLGLCLTPLALLFFIKPTQRRLLPNIKWKPAALIIGSLILTNWIYLIVHHI